MNQTYNQVPNIITGKDLDYLSDMFTWNYGAYKKSIACANQTENQEIKDVITKALQMFHDNMTTILNMLSEGGLNE